MTILIGYLPAPEGQAALEAGFREAQVRNTDAIVVTSPRKGAPDVITSLDDDAKAAILNVAKHYKVNARIEQPLHEDDLVGTLNDFAEKHGCELIVIGLRKRSAIGKFILGSQAQRILLDSTIPVLTTKASVRLSH